METKFLKYKNSDDWWEWPQDGTMTVYNINGGWHEINENSEAFMEGTVITAEGWPDLCAKMNYNPWKVDRPTREMWIDPEGVMYDCGEWGAHEITAQNILEKKFGILEHFWDSGDKLIEMGWTKVTANYIMYQHYCEAGLYDYCTDEQWKTIKLWRERYMN